MNQLLVLGLIFVLNLWATCSGFPLEIEFFTQTNCTGQSIKFNQSQTNFDCVKTLFGEVDTFWSYRRTGWWALAGEPDYWGLGGSGTDNSYCIYLSYEFLTIDQAIPLGLGDSNVPAIAILPRLKTHEVFVTDKPAEAFLNATLEDQFIQIVTTGMTNWTVFEDNNFEGESVCLIAETEIDLFDTLNIRRVGSLLKDCFEQFASKILHPRKLNKVPNSVEHISMHSSIE